VRLSEIKEVSDLIDVYKKAQGMGVSLMKGSDGRLTLRELQRDGPRKSDVELVTERLLEQPQ
jgi:hypothetical protein